MHVTGADEDTDIFYDPHTIQRWRTAGYECLEERAVDKGALALGSLTELYIASVYLLIRYLTYLGMSGICFISSRYVVLSIEIFLRVVMSA